jgi:hypothetical protein
VMPRWAKIPIDKRLEIQKPPPRQLPPRQLPPRPRLGIQFRCNNGWTNHYGIFKLTLDILAITLYNSKRLRKTERI